jgi:hypothetical protein
MVIFTTFSRLSLIIFVNHVITVLILNLHQVSFGYVYAVRLKGKTLMYTMLYEEAMVTSTFPPSMGIIATGINRTSHGVPWRQPLFLQFSLLSG